MNTHFTGGLLLTSLFLLVVVALPMKLGAVMADAKRTGLLWCGLAAFVGLLAGYMASGIFHGVIGGPLAAAIGYILAIRFMLGTTVAGAIGLTIIAMLLSFVGVVLLAHLGVILSGPTPGGVAI
ncbi:MAG TPA: hypothetical protein VF848_01040 [Steroidobacteraceae bacterium]